MLTPGNPCFILNDDDRYFDDLRIAFLMSESESNDQATYVPVALEGDVE